jgi:serralysin
VLQFSLQGLGEGMAFDATVLRGSHTLANGTVLGGFERVDLAGTTGNDEIRAGDFADTISGMAGQDSLYGGGGADEVYGGGGNDWMYGGNGNDRLFVFDGYSFLAGGTGNDILESVSAMGQEMRGQTGVDTLIGGSGDDVLYGGTGADVLTGGGGLDDFWFTEMPGAGEADRIEDFAASVDDFFLNARVFTGFAAGSAGGFYRELLADSFVLGVAAADETDRIIHDPATGQIWHDADGMGGAAAVLFASVTAGTALTAGDFAGY